MWDPSAFPRSRGAAELSRDGRLARLVFNNPAARNAMSVGMMADFLDGVERLASDPPTALIMHGQPGAGFCAGGDLRDVRAHLMNSATAAGMPEVMGDALHTLASLPTVIVAAVEGYALGGGAELTQAADVIIAAESARIGFVQARLGVSPGWGGGALLIDRVGRSRALQVLAAARRYTAVEALAVGLVDEVVGDGQALDAADALAANVLESPTESVQGILQIIRSSDPKRTERAVFAELWSGERHRAVMETVNTGSE